MKRPITLLFSPIDTTHVAYANITLTPSRVKRTLAARRFVEQIASQCDRLHIGSFACLDCDKGYPYMVDVSSSAAQDMDLRLSDLRQHAFIVSPKVYPADPGVEFTTHIARYDLNGLSFISLRPNRAEVQSPPLTWQQLQTLHDGGNPFQTEAPNAQTPP